MRMILLAGAVLALGACSGAKDADQNNALASDNMMVDDAKMALDANMSTDQNSALDSVNAAAANGSVDAATANAMAKDAKTHDADTNLANGM